MASKVKTKKTECQICGKEVVNLKDHLKVHDGLKQFKCEYCEKEFKRKHELTAHLL